MVLLFACDPVLCQSIFLFKTINIWLMCPEFLTNLDVQIYYKMLLGSVTYNKGIQIMNNFFFLNHVDD